jgi:hypothetical protein
MRFRETQQPMRPVSACARAYECTHEIYMRASAGRESKAAAHTPFLAMPRLLPPAVTCAHALVIGLNPFVCVHVQMYIYISVCARTTINFLCAFKHLALCAAYMRSMFSRITLNKFNETCVCMLQCACACVLQFACVFAGLLPQSITNHVFMCILRRVLTHTTVCYSEPVCMHACCLYARILSSTQLRLCRLHS